MLFWNKLIEYKEIPEKIPEFPEIWHKSPEIPELSKWLGIAISIHKLRYVQRRLSMSVHRGLRKYQTFTSLRPLLSAADKAQW